jgi:hypothetical protein
VIELLTQGKKYYDSLNGEAETGMTMTIWPFNSLALSKYGISQELRGVKSGINREVFL